MNGPEHYRVAERLVAMCVDSDGQPPAAHTPELDHYIALAQVHATLALTAATVDRTGVAYNIEAWTEATP